MFQNLLIHGKQNSEESLNLENTRPLQNLISLWKSKYKYLSFWVLRSTQVHLKRNLMINLYLHKAFSLQSEINLSFKSARKATSSQYAEKYHVEKKCKDPKENLFLWRHSCVNIKWHITLGGLFRGRGRGRNLRKTGRNNVMYGGNQVKDHFGLLTLWYKGLQIITFLAAVAQNNYCPL